MSVVHATPEPPIAAPDTGEPDMLADQLRRSSRAVIDQELGRLARRAPALTPGDLHAVSQALDGLVERLLLSRVRAAPCHAQYVRDLFGPAI